MNCYLVGTGNRDLNNPLNWSSISGGAGADLLGSEKITNGDFSVDSNWNKQTGWSISGGVAVSNNGTGFIFQNSGITPLKLYKITYTVVTITNGFVRILFNGGSNKYGAIRNSVGLYTEYIQAHSLANGNISFESTYFIGTVDNLSVKEVLCFPNSSNPAIIDANSSIANGDVLSLSAQFDCVGFDCSAAAYTFTLSNAAYAFNVYGDFKDSIKRVNGFSSTGYLYIKGNCNIYSNGATQGWNRIYFDGVGATFTNQDDWNTGLIRISAGTWDTSGKTISATEYRTEGSGVKIIYFRNSIINCSGEFTFQSGSNITFNCGTSTINGTHQLRGGVGRVYYNVNMVSSAYFLFQDNCTFNNLSLTYTGGGIATANFYDDIIVNANLTVIGSNANRSRLLISNPYIGSQRTITVNGSIVASNVDFRDITLAGTANRDLSTISGGSGDCGGNSGITFTPAIDCYIKHTSGSMNVSDATKWVTTDGGTTQARVPLMQDRAWGTANSFTGTATINMNCPRIGSIDLSGVNQAVTFALANNVESYGSYILGDNITQSGDFINYVYGRGIYEIKAFGNTLYYLAINAPTGILNFTSDIIIRRSYEARAGTINHNNHHITASHLQWYGASILNLNLSIIELNAQQIPSYIIDSNPTIVINGGSSVIYLNPITTSNNFIANLNGKTFNKVIFSGQHTGNFVISGNNTFNELIIEKGRKVQITGGSTQTISPTGKFIADGIPTEQIQITSTNTTPFNLVYAGTGFHQVNYCNISYCNATSDRFYAGKNSVDGGNNTGWKFRSYLTKYTTTIKRKLKLVN